MYFFEVDVTLNPAWLHQSLFDSQVNTYVQPLMPWAAVKLTALKLQLNQRLWNKPKKKVQQ